MIDETTNAERIGFCQDCGKPLTTETVRPVGSGVFCEPCLEKRVGTTAPPPPYGTVPPAADSANGTVPPFQEPFPPVGGDNPSPVLAGLLGLIPGVGAMYNGQYAKGIAHLVIFMVLEAITDRHGFSDLLVVGWVFYQAFDAYHTAKARRDGRPLPDPFGLNNIGSQVSSHFRNTTPGVPPNPPTNYPGWTGYTPPQQPIVTPQPEPVVPPPPAAWGSVPVTPPPVAPHVQSAPPAQEWSTPAYDPTAYAAVPARKSGVPGAAVWLIGLGVLFLLMNILPEWRFSVDKIFPFVLMAFAGWIFYRRMSCSGGLSPAAGEGSAYTQRALCWVRLPVILFTVAVLWALQEFDVVRLGQTWPVLVIVLGVLLLLERAVGSRTVPAVEPPVVNGDGKVL